MAPRAALGASVGALACAACCVLPIAFPAIALAGGGAVMVWIDGATKVMFIAALTAVLGGWAWVHHRARKTGKRTARATITMMGVASAIFAAGLAFPVYEPFIIRLIEG